MKQIDQLQIATHGCVQFIHLLHHGIIISYQRKNLSAPSLAKTFFIQVLLPCFHVLLLKVHITHAIFFIDLWISYQLFSSHMIFAIFFMPYKNCHYICVRQLLVAINNFNCCFILSSAMSKLMAVLDNCIYSSSADAQKEDADQLILCSHSCSHAQAYIR